MKFGVREICDVVLKAKNNQYVGNKYFYKDEPVIYFDTLKTSSMEGAATTVYAQGGRGNSRLVAWEGERTVTFTMEDALISPEGFMILSGAGLIQGKSGNSIKVHTTEQTNAVTFNASTNTYTIYLKQKPFKPSNSDGKDYVYIMPLNKNHEIYTEQYVDWEWLKDGSTTIGDVARNYSNVTLMDDNKLPDDVKYFAINLKVGSDSLNRNQDEFGSDFGKVVLVDFYVEKTSGTFQVDITPDKFGGFYYLEASTLFRTQDGHDMPAEFIIPKCKIQSNFTFTMASSGDPSTFTFTIDAFPDYTRFDGTKKVFASIQVIEDDEGEDTATRQRTNKEEEIAAVNGITPIQIVSIKDNNDNDLVLSGNNIITAPDASSVVITYNKEIKTSAGGSASASVTINLNDDITFSTVKDYTVNTTTGDVVGSYVILSNYGEG